MEYLPELKGLTVYPDGSRENQPLTPLPVDKAVEAVHNSVEGTSAVDSCRSGSCDV